MALDRWQILGYLLSFVSPVLGLIVGIMLYTDNKNKEHKPTGKYVVILSIIMTIVWGLLVIKRPF